VSISFEDGYKVSCISHDIEPTVWRLLQSYHKLKQVLPEVKT